MSTYVYIIKNTHGKIYTGISENPLQRLQEHNSKRGSTYTKNGNFEIGFLEEYPDLSLARKREIQIKKWRREKKELLIELFRSGLETKMT